VDHGKPLDPGGVVDNVSSPEVVRAVDDEVVAGEQVADVPLVEPRLVRLHVDVGIEPVDVPRRRLDLRLAHVGVAVDHLPLEVRALDHVAVDDPDCADARGREVLDDRRAEPAGADHERASVEEALLPPGRPRP